MTHPTSTLALSPLLLLLVGGLSTGCGTGSLDSSAGGNAQFSTGKADAYGSCETDKTLAYVNAASTTQDSLKSIGVRSRARRNIVDYRNGTDGLLGTSDDNLFDSLGELDAIKYVGPATLDRIVQAGLASQAGAEACQSLATGSVEVVFSPQAWGDSHLAKVAQRINAATDTIDLAMYSLSDGTVIQALEAAAKRGVSIRLLFNSAANDRKSPAGTLSARLEDAGIDVHWINKIMHHKFAIFDGPRRDPSLAASAKIVSGSGNWSYSAGTRYDENTLFITGNVELALRLQAQFDHLWNNSRDLVWNSSIVGESGAAVDQAAIDAADQPAVDAAFTSDNFRSYESSRYGATFSSLPGLNTVSDRLVAMIDGAQRQILIASGHLRSRPVAEALMRKAQENPAVEIRVLLDNQEYVSASYDSDQVRKHNRCLADATTERQTQACNDKGFLFSHSLVEAGIPVHFKAYAYRWHYSYAKQMHDKYMIVDGQHLATGSYNLSDNAEHNTMENVLFFEASAFPGLLESYVLNFESMWNLGRAEGLYAAKMNEIQNGSRRIAIVFDPMSLDWQQVTDLKNAIRTTCSDVNSNDFRYRPEAHYTCTRR